MYHEVIAITIGLAECYPLWLLKGSKKRCHSLYSSVTLNLSTPEMVASLSNSGDTLIMWLDLMKFGVLSANELNNLVSLIKKGLGAMPTKACCFAIAPQSCSGRRSGIREEFRMCRVWDVVYLTHPKIKTVWNVHPFWMRIHIVDTPGVTTMPWLGVLRTSWWQSLWNQSQSTWGWNTHPTRRRSNSFIGGGWSWPLVVKTRMPSVAALCSKTGHHQEQTHPKQVQQ